MDAWKQTSLEEMGKDLGRLRRGTSETEFEWETTRIANRLWWLLASERPSAADLVREGWSVENALVAASYETRRMDRLLGF